MQDREYVSDLRKHVGEVVSLKGSVHVVRVQGEVSFLMLRDVSGIVQSVIVKSNTPNVFDLLKSLPLESCVKVVGEVKEEARVEAGVEVEVKELSLISSCTETLPIPVYTKGDTETSVNIRQRYRFLDLRKPKNALIMKLISAFDQYYREFLLDKGFIEIHTPKLMPTPSESSSDLFEVKYFDRKAFLAQSPQLYKQMAIASGLERVFEVGPIFRAEKSFTTRHATECTSYDMEMAFIKSHEDIMSLEENLIVFILKRIKDKYGDDVRRIFGINIGIPELPFPRITMSDAKILLHSDSADTDLTSEEEKMLGEYFYNKNLDFVFLTDFPVAARPFYHKRYENKPFTKSADLIYKGLEITTLAQREERVDILTKQLLEKGAKTTDIQWYLDFFKYGVPPHGGWGLGGARFIMKLLNLESIRDAMFLFRGVKHLHP